MRVNLEKVENRNEFVREEMDGNEEKVVKKAPCEQPIIDGKYYWQLEFVGEALLSMEQGPMVLSGWSTTSGEHVDAGEHQYSPQWMVLASQPTTR